MRFCTHIISHSLRTRAEALSHRYLSRCCRELEIPPHAPRHHHPGDLLPDTSRYIETGDHGRFWDDYARIFPRDLRNCRRWEDRYCRIRPRYLPHRSRLCRDESYPAREKSTQMRSVITPPLSTHGTRTHAESDPNDCFFTDGSIWHFSDIPPDNGEDHTPGIYNDRDDLSHGDSFNCEKKVICQCKKFCKLHMFIVYFVCNNLTL